MKKLTILCVLLLITLSALSLVAHFVLVVQVNYEIGRATRELLSMQEQQQQLKIEIAALRSPERLEKIALEEIGLHYPTHSQLIVLTAGNLEVGD
ncbi:MAG: cell division protein FtsL [Dethiobacter sp.]|nr:cell division protein FtsL [Dethiobacter sp.]